MEQMITFTRDSKLVRDKIPMIAREQAQEDGRSLPYTFGLLNPGDQRNLAEQYGAKVIEEAQEVYKVLSDLPNCGADTHIERTRKKELTEEMADVLEILYAVCDRWGIEREEVEKVRVGKALDRGRFDLGVMLVPKEPPTTLLPFFADGEGPMK